MVVTKAVVIPTTDRVDESRRIKLPDNLGELLLGLTFVKLTPSLVVNDLTNS